ncbi:hypothetical protein SAMN06298216_2628 [Spirosomataceae bacterium TFI 002]|nr:hypothetical protein SAMN06298216_2628 [Spirosomataceae bacterium TFI 002]
MKNIFAFIFISLLLSFPVRGTIVVSSGLTVIQNIPSKGYKEGVIILKNTGNRSESFRCYLNDLTTNCDGEVFYKESGENPSSLAPFLTTSVTEATLTPGEEYELVYKVDLSKSDLENGTLWSLLMVEVVKPISETVTDGGFAVGSKIRYGIQIISNIGNQEDPEMNFTQVKLGKDLDQNSVLEASLENSGKFIALPKVEIQIFNSKGEKVRDLNVISKKIYPQNCQKFQVPIHDLSEGKYKAVLFAEYLESTIGLNIDLEI